ncbi:hypothetical protein JCM11641_007812 [Rhodosporidiobolus odoratus]
MIPSKRIEPPPPAHRPHPLEISILTSSDSHSHNLLTHKHRLEPHCASVLRSTRHPTGPPPSFSPLLDPVLSTLKCRREPLPRRAGCARPRDERDERGPRKESKGKDHRSISDSPAQVSWHGPE